MIGKTEIISGLEKVRLNSPLVHNITNYVVMNNTANALLAIGASPVMAHAIDEVEEMASIASSLVINMGTLSEQWVDSMLTAGKSATKKGIPVIFDPVGVGATKYRTSTAEAIIKICKPSVIRGNASEIMALNKANVKTKGVDSTQSSNSAIDSAKQLAKKTKSVVVISGETDFITDGETLISIKNGSALMPKVTGMGCTATAIIGACAGVEKDMLAAASMAMAIISIAGEIATEKSSGPGSMQVNFIDELYKLTSDSISTRLNLNYE